MMRPPWATVVPGAGVPAACVALWFFGNAGDVTANQSYLLELLRVWLVVGALTVRCPH